MKHNSLKFLFIAASISIGLSSCDGYLDQMPSNALPSDESINNIEDVGSALNGVIQVYCLANITVPISYQEQK